MATVTIHAGSTPAKAHLYHWTQPAGLYLGARDYYELEVEAGEDRVVIFGDTLDDLRAILVPPATEERPSRAV